MVLLTAAATLWGARPTRTILIVAAGVVALAIPPNIAKFYDSRSTTVSDSESTKTEYAMLELARRNVDLAYIPGADPRIDALGGHIFIPLSAGNYLRAADEFGSLAYSLDRVRHLDLELRTIADASLAGALDLKLDRSDPPADPAACPASRDGGPGHSVFFFLPPGGALLGSQAGHYPIQVAAGRFGTGGPGVSLGRLAPGEWAELNIPRDAAPDRWWLTVDGPVTVCPPPTSGR
jgi:hypothetical protein